MTTPLFAPGFIQQLQWQVLFNNALLPGLLSSEVEQNSHYQADKWRVDLALGAVGGMTLDQWGADGLVGQTFIIQARLQPSDPWATLIEGEADKIRINVVDGVVSCEGRDLTSRLIDEKTQDAYLNKTASEVATLLAQKHGLTPVVTATTTLVSRYYQQDHDKVSHDQFSRSGTEWSLLSFLAEDEGFDLFVNGRELHFQPSNEVSKTYGVTWEASPPSSNVLTIELERSLTLAKDVIVEVRSWSGRHARSFTKTSGKGGPNAVQSGKAQKYVFTFPNLSEARAQQKANELREEISRHERLLELTLPVELALTTRDQVVISGVGASWEQTYYVASVSRTFSAEEGGTIETVHLKNHSPESEAGAP